jgi:class 3 adenylate cyclase/tetratricopeptide (TPR) repeat protein
VPDSKEDMAACPRCGEANPARARFCLACGAPLGERTAPREMRKTVTIVFTDVIDSTPLGERLDAETYRRVISRYFIEVSRVLEHHGGTVEKFIGDAVMAAFGIPILHEDDALRAVRAAAELREALAQLNVELGAQYGLELGMRTGINTGEVVAGDPTEGHAFATGEAVALAQRLEAAASPGEILVGESTYRLVRDAALVEPLDPLELKGRSQPVNAWRLLAVVAGAPAFARRLDAPMIGRQAELALLGEVFEEAVRDHTCRLVTVLGPAGIGKSRLINELLADVRAEARVLLGRCLPYGEGITYWPLRELVRDAARELSQQAIEDLLQGEPEAGRIAARVAGAIGVGETVASHEDTMWAVRRLLEHLAREQPLIVGFDDLQWAEPTFIDLIEYLCGWTRDAPILIVCLARPEFRDRFPACIAHGETITLNPLSALQAEELLGHLRGETDVDADMLARITQAAEGNPLFVEQMLAMLTENGTASADLAIPPTIHALLAARLDRLSADERAVIERASVVGKEFWRTTVTELSPEPERELVGASLMTLARKELIEPARSSLEEEDTFKFRHILIRDAAYLGIPKETRAELHERCADWLEATAGDRAAELDEIIGYHLEQAYGFREELGPVAEGAAALARRAGERLAAAGRRAVRRGDTSAAASLISRAVKLLSSDHPSRPELLAELASTLMFAGDFDRVGPILDEASEAAGAIGDRRLELRLAIEREFFRTFTEPEGSALDDSTVADTTIPLLEELGDDRGLARAWLLKSDPDVNACRWGARADALERALEHARRGGVTTDFATLTFVHAQALYYGRTPVPEAIQRCEQYLADYPDDRLLEASVSTVLAGLRAMEGDFDEARSLYSHARVIHEELGRRFRIATVASMIAAEIEQLAGQSGEAVSILRWAYDTVREMGAMSATATIAAFLADALSVDGRSAEAVELSEFAEENAPDSDVVTQVLWRMARARALAGEDPSAAEELARDALALTRETDYPDLEARALTCVAQAIGPGKEQAALLGEARRLYEAKGNVAAAARLPAESPARS